MIDPVLRAAADHGGLPVVVHGFAPTTADDLVTLSALSGRYPTVPLVVSQLGGLNWMQAVELVRDTPNMYLELSTANVVFAVRLAIKEIPDRTLFGSDPRTGIRFSPGRWWSGSQARVRYATAYSVGRSPNWSVSPDLACRGPWGGRHQLP